MREHRIVFNKGPWEISSQAAAQARKSAFSAIYANCFAFLCTKHPRLGAGQIGLEWCIYDVGGCRTQRAAWLPFFENTNVIIFCTFPSRLLC